MNTPEKIAVIGLGYVGLPLGLALARAFDDVVGYDISKKRVDDLSAGRDWAEEHSADSLKNTTLRLSHNAADLGTRSFFIVTVPTPITPEKKPDLSPLLSACVLLAEAIKQKKASRTPVIVFESTVYPGLTEEICGAEIARLSGLKQGVDFKLGYSPERINPGDPNHKLETIVKVVAAQDAETLARLHHVYGAVITAGLHEAPSIAVAEAAKVLENTQRDLNVALMNELAMICDKLNIRTRDVLDAAATKWNFLRFTPGLVGGHCIGVDPYYLTTRAESLGLHPQVILAGRSINDSMGAFVAGKAYAWVAEKNIAQPRIAILGLTFKENVRDLRNSRVPDIVDALKEKNITPLVHDPMVDNAMAQHEYAITPCGEDELRDVDVLILAVPHQMFLDAWPRIATRMKKGGFIMDIKSALSPQAITEQGLAYWSL